MCEKHPRVSVVITAYNYGLFLPEAIESVLGQTFKDFQVVVVDDGSTDNTSEAILPYLSNPCLRYIRKENGGQASAKNRGIAESKGEFIAFLDADDVWFRTKLEEQIPLFSDPNIGVVYSKRVLMDPHGNERPFQHPTLHRGYVLDQMFINNFVCFSSAILRRECFEKVGKFDESLPMAIDYDLWLRIAMHYHFDYVNEPLVKYRLGHGHMSENKDKRFECAWRVMNRFLEDPSLNEHLSWWVPRYARAHTYGSMGEYYLSQKRLLALRFFIKSLQCNPFYFLSWKGVVNILLRRH
jgi:glycosyltransferase involved in cell wall biosynthesis